METTKDKRVKREIANSNERRRMQSINAGFQKLKRLLPVNDGEKLSKASILQHAADFIQQIERDKLILYEQNTLFRGIIEDIKKGTDITTALDNIDPESLQIIPINTHISLDSSNPNDTSNNAHNNSNDTITTDNNSNDDCIKSNNKNGNNNKVHTATKNNNPSITNTSNATIVTATTTATIINSNNKYPTTTITFNDVTKNNYQGSLNQSTAEITCDRVTSPKNGLASSGVAKAAIALPLEVPYTSETAIRVDHHHHQNLQTDTQPTNARKILKTDQASIDSQDPASKGQTLDTICKAIIQIEGDRVFTNENIKHET